MKTTHYYIVDFFVRDSQGSHTVSPVITSSIEDARFIADVAETITTSTSENYSQDLSHLIKKHSKISTRYKNKFEKLESNDDILDEMIDLVGLDVPCLSSRKPNLYLSHSITLGTIAD